MTPTCTHAKAVWHSTKVHMQLPVWTLLDCICHNFYWFEVTTLPVGYPVGQSWPGVAVIGSMLGAHWTNDNKICSTVALFGMLWREEPWIFTYCDMSLMHCLEVTHKQKWFGMGSIPGKVSCNANKVIWYVEQFVWQVNLITSHLKKIEFEAFII